MTNIVKPCFVMSRKKRHSVNYAKDWLDHLFLFPGLFWSVKGFHMNLIKGWQSTTIFLLWGLFFCMVTNGQTKTQPVDPRVSLLLTSDQAVISKNWKAVTRTFHWLPFLGIFYLNQFQAILQCKKGKNSKFDIFSELMPINPIRPGIF